MSEGSGHLELCGQRIEYRLVGPAPDQAPTVVLLHEGLGCVAMWRDFPEQLAGRTGCGVLVWSRAGYGGSSPCTLPRPLSYMHHEALRTMPRLLDAIGLRAGVVLGHSDGASIAAIHAGACRDRRVRGLVLMAPHFFTEEAGIAEIARARVAYRDTDLRARLARYHGDNVDNAFEGWSGAWLDPGFRHWDLRGFLGSIDVPVLVIQGTQDQYGTLAHVEAVRELCPAPVQTLVLEACAHAPHRDQPERTLSAVSALVARVLPPAQVMAS